VASSGFSGLNRLRRALATAGGGQGAVLLDGEKRITSSLRPHGPLQGRHLLPFAAVGSAARSDASRCLAIGCSQTALARNLGVEHFGPASRDQIRGTC